jgi:outer membrane protein assembly factor BamA
VLSIRGFAELAVGDRDDIPFTELARLGGSQLLRGYQVDRFRDRGAALVQVNYLWAASESLAGSLFVDCGRVFSGADDLGLELDPTALRLGYGVGLELYSGGDVLVRSSVSSSIDGGLFIDFGLTPAFDARARAERR